ncbi:MAG: hypothetical protein Q7R66_14810 [Undibacterium sp.]|uniref:PilN domain-containing protein n=1 Tax=Undibacterium sp. TaxID=1914977 RepID=UPI002717CA8A|nr:PilN domain-containing protein [Undibacterium sp.]MDO8653455.1 hypothetical protein [Undibacterium sp.]
MKPVRIDFTKPSLRRTLSQTKFPDWLIAGVGISLCVSAAIAVFQQRDREQIQQMRQMQQRQTLKEHGSATLPVVKTAISLTQANAVNHAVLQLNLPWQDLQNSLEAATTSKVALLTLEPDAKSRTLKVSAEAKNSDDMLLYIEQLKQQIFFSSVVLVKHETNELDANKPLRFQLDVQWQNGRVAP